MVLLTMVMLLMKRGSVGGAGSRGMALLGIKLVVWWIVLLLWMGGLRLVEIVHTAVSRLCRIEISGVIFMDS